MFDAIGFDAVVAVLDAAPVGNGCNTNELSAVSRHWCRSEWPNWNGTSAYIEFGVSLIGTHKFSFNWLMHWPWSPFESSDALRERSRPLLDDRGAV